MAGFNHQNFSRFQWTRDPVSTSLRRATHRPLAKQMRKAAASEHKVVANAKGTLKQLVKDRARACFLLESCLDNLA